MRDKAKALYCHGGRTAKEIAEKLNIPLNTVKSWQARDKWGKARKEAGGDKIYAIRKKYAPSKKKVAEGADEKVAKKVANEGAEKAKKVHKGGPPIGSMNAVGHGAPKGNHNGYKHGAYSSITKWGVLSDEEIEFIKEVAVDDVEAQLIQEVEIYAIREQRILKAIKKMQDEKKGAEDTVVDTVSASEKRLANDPKKRVGVVEMHSTKTSVMNTILRLEKELSTVQSGKARAIAALNDYRAVLREDDRESIIDHIEGMFEGIREEANARIQEQAQTE